MRAADSNSIDPVATMPPAHVAARPAGIDVTARPAGIDVAARPTQVQPHAWLSGGGVHSAISPGTTVGVLRDPSKPAPDVRLSVQGEAFRYVSHLHGTFSCRDGAWFFTNVGRNGTRVRRNGAYLECVDGEPFRLEDGDDLSFADGPLVRFLCRDCSGGDCSGGDFTGAASAWDAGAEIDG